MSGQRTDERDFAGFPGTARAHFDAIDQPSDRGHGLGSCVVNFQQGS